MTLISSEDIVKTDKKCPKCKSRDFTIEEQWSGHYITWEVIDGEFDINDGNLEAGYPSFVICKCKKCKHIWRTRKAGQVHDLIKYPD